MERTDASAVRTASGLNVLLAVWMIISPFILSYSATAAYWNQIITAIIIGILAIARMVAPRVVWMSWVNVVAGIWLIISPFLLSYNTAGSKWNSVIFGIVAIILSLWSMGETATSSTGSRV